MSEHLDTLRAVLDGTISGRISEWPQLKPAIAYAVAALSRSEVPAWQPIETAPRDGTRILGWSEEFGARETYMRKFGEGSIGYANWKAGKGPAESGWEWHEPQSGWVGGWSPTHWSELSTPAEGLSR